MRRPRQAVGGLPRSVVVEWQAALAVVARRVVPAHAPAVDLRAREREGERDGEKTGERRWTDVETDRRTG